MYKQKGFTLVEGLLVVIALGIIGFGGYYVWSQNQGDEVEPVETVQNEQAAEDEQLEVIEEQYQPPEGWVEYANEEIGIVFAHPSSWGNPELSLECPGRDGCEGTIRFFNFDNAMIQMGGVTTGAGYPVGGGELGSDGYTQQDIENKNELVTELTSGNQNALLTEDLTDILTVEYGNVYRYKLEFNLDSSIVDGFAFYVLAQEESVTSEDIDSLYKSFRQL